MNDQADSCPALFANSGNENTVHAIGGRRVQMQCGGGPLDAGGGRANKRINKKMQCSKRIGCFLCTVWVTGSFFDSGYMGITWTVWSLYVQNP
jgi:hypothetical protein